MPADREPEDALSAYLRQECSSALVGELALRDEVDVDGVHDTRVSLRRIRSTLRLFADLLTPESVAMDDELRWVAGLLSDVRDADVLRKHLRRKVADLPAELVMGPVRDELDEAIGGDRDAAIRRWRGERDSTRYADALAAMAAWSQEPPLREPLTDEQLAGTGREVLDKARHKARKRLRQAGEDPVLTHRARKAVKRYRYAADLLEPVVPEAKKDGKRAKEVQSALGDHQDLFVEAAFLRHQAGRFGGRTGHNGFTYGLLMARADRDAADIRAARHQL